MRQLIARICSQHAIIFGERGVGKTSLANLIYDMLVLAGKSSYQRARINCSEHMDFDYMWASLFKIGRASCRERVCVPV